MRFDKTTITGQTLLEKNRQEALLPAPGLFPFKSPGAAILEQRSVYLSRACKHALAAQEKKKT